MKIIIYPHTLERCEERGASVEESKTPYRMELLSKQMEIAKQNIECSISLKNVTENSMNRKGSKAGDAFNNPVVYVDYGQPNQTKIDFYITDASSSRKPINSDVDALNYMYRNAWELVSSRQSIQLSTSNRSYYFQKKGK
ncbi:MAG: hypothetical protein LH473_06250 [Chitinophagales bacterium]|nr:hypothetical protein [Chitinophagales bacterium]